MTIMRFVRWLFVLLIVVGAGAFVIINYSWVFAKRVQGRIISVERVTETNAIISSRITPEQMHSYAILIQGDDGNLYTASSEDRKWQVVKTGYCVDTLLYRYPPWDLRNANTFFNARLDEIRLCPGETEPPEEKKGIPESPATEPAAPPSPGSEK